MLVYPGEQFICISFSEAAAMGRLEPLSRRLPGITHFYWRFGGSCRDAESTADLLTTRPVNFLSKSAREKFGRALLCVEACCAAAALPLRTGASNGSVYGSIVGSGKGEPTTLGQIERRESGSGGRARAAGGCRQPGVSGAETSLIYQRTGCSDASKNDETRREGHA